jgi:hypothetical protein
MKHLQRLLLSAAVAVAAFAGPAAADPWSVMYPTRTDDLLSRDFERIALLAESLAALNGRMAYHMYDIPAGLCPFSLGCGQVQQTYVDPIAARAGELAVQARAIYDDPGLSVSDYPLRMQSLRSKFNELAWAQSAFHQAMTQIGLVTFNDEGADRYCQAIFAQYWYILEIIVQTPPRLGIGGGPGTDD